MIQYGRKKQPGFFERVASFLHQINLVMFCLVSALVLLCWGGALWLSQTHFNQYFKFHHVKLVMEAHHIKPRALVKRIASHLEGGFFALDTEKLYHFVKQDPWIKDVTFRRIWPDTLRVTVTEQIPFAVWNKTSLINLQGDIFTPFAQKFPSNLLNLAGPKGSETEVLAKLKQFNKQLSPLRVKITGLELNSRNAWQMEINNQFKVMLGQKELEAEMKRFIVLYTKKIGLSGKEALNVDMRYPNGAAIKWKK